MVPMKTLNGLDDIDDLKLMWYFLTSLVISALVVLVRDQRNAKEN
jgi:hypothetical protein